MWTVNSLAVFKAVSIITVFFIVLCLKASCCGFTSAAVGLLGSLEYDCVLWNMLKWQCANVCSQLAFLSFSLLMQITHF